MVNSIKQKATTMVMHKNTNYMLIAFILAAGLFYIYFAEMTVRTLTILQKTKGQMQSLSIDVSEMESKRLAVENGISTEKALLLGFVEVNNPTFIMRNSRKTSLSFKID
jgi:hypothetical protein